MCAYFFAIEGTDFAALASSEVTFTAGNQIKCLAIPIMASNSTESGEWFTVTLDEIIVIHASNAITYHQQYAVN